MRNHLVVMLALSTGCVGFGNTDSSIEGEGGDDTDTGDRDDCKIEGDAIGQEGATILLASRTLTFGSWVPKTDSPGEFVGFTLAVSDGSTFGYVVKAGGELHPSTSTVWVHPAGPDGGADAPGISNIDGCDGEEPPGDEPTDPDPTDPTDDAPTSDDGPLL